MLRTIAILLALLLLGCSNTEQEVAEHYSKGIEHTKRGDTRAAVLEFKNVLQLDPRHAKARYQLGLAYLEQGDPASLDAAHDELGLAVAQDPSHLDARLRLAELSLTLGKPKQGEDHAHQAVQLAPKSSNALVLRGRSHLAQRSLDRAVADFHSALEHDAKHIQARVYLARALMLQDNYDAAKRQLAAALETAPNAPLVHLALGELHELTSDIPSAQAAYEKALKLADSHDKEAALKLSGFFRRHERWDAAEALYKKQAAARPKDPQAFIALGAFYADAHKPELARKHLEHALSLDPGSAVAEDKLLDLRLEAGEFDELRADLKALAKKRGDHPLLKYYEARIALSKHKHDQAIDLLRALVKQHPNAGAAHMLLASTLSATGALSEARVALERAAQVEAVAAQAHVELAKTYLAEDEARPALRHAELAYDIDRRQVENAVVLSRALARAGQLARASEVLEAAIKHHPKNPALLFRLAALARHQGHDPRALELLNRALELDPEFDASLHEIVQIHLANKEHDKARARVEAQLKKAPDHVAYHNLLGELLEERGNFAGAEAAYLSAAEKLEIASDSYAKLAHLYLKNKRTEQGTRRFTEQLAQGKNRLAAHVVLGIVHHVKGNTKAAGKHYEAALQLNPNAAIAANNLANLLFDAGHDTERALDLAKRAYAARPHDANVMDTLGWLYYAKGDYQTASTLLAMARRHSPNNPIFLYHHGMALAKLPKRRADARRSLEKLLQVSPDFPEAAKAKRTLEQL